MLGVGGRLPQSRDWSFLSIYTLRQLRSISLACNPALIIRSRSLFYTSVIRRSRMSTPGDGTEPIVTEPNVAVTYNPERFACH